MDTFQIRQVIPFLVFFLFLAISSPSRASSNASYDEAMRECLASSQADPAPPQQSCHEDGSDAYGNRITYTNWAGADATWRYSGDPPVAPNTCSSIPTFQQTGDEGSPGGHDMCVKGVGGTSGQQGCAFHATQTGNAWQNSDGKWKTKESISPQGGTCTMSPDGKTWTFGDGGTSPTPTDIPAPATLPPAPTVSPQVCQDGSCYNPNDVFF